MKKAKKKQRKKTDDDMRPEYDFSKGERGKYAARYLAGTKVIRSAPRTRRHKKSSA